MSQKKNWREVKSGQEIANFKEVNTLTLKFLDDGQYSENETFTRKDGSSGIIKKKVSFQVIDLKDNKQKSFNTSSSRLMEKLSEISNNLKDYTLQITAIGTSYSRNFDVQIISKPK